MKRLGECEFSAFISYAHADDEVWFRWVTQFRNELECSLRAMLRGVKLPEIHLSGDNGPVAGVLSEELKARVAKSFAMIIVVHDNYAQSQWCLHELEYFRELFGEQGFRQRLYIVALSESAMLAVSGGSAWKRIVPTEEQLWIPFFDSTDRNRPLDIYLGQGVVAPGFRVPFERLRSDLVTKLKAAAALPLAAPPVLRPKDAATPANSTSASTSTSAAALTPVPVPVPAAAQTRALIGFVAAASAGAAAALAVRLKEAGVAAQLLLQDAVFTEFADFDNATDLVLAFDDQPVMLASMSPGGHLQVQQEAWIRKGKPASRLHWLDLRETPASPAPASGGAAVVQALQGQGLVFDALLQRLRPPPVAAAPAALRHVRIYIESNRNERTLWEPLGEQIRLKWEQVCGTFAGTDAPALSLRTRGLPVDQLDSFPDLDDADGVVLLWGRKTSEALVAQINKVENKMAPGRDAAPGIVAYLMPPQQASEPVPAWGWQVLRFNTASEEDIEVVSEESAQLERFLRKVYQRRQQRDRTRGGV